MKMQFVLSEEHFVQELHFLFSVMLLWKVSLCKLLDSMDEGGKYD